MKIYKLIQSMIFSLSLVLAFPLGFNAYASDANGGVTTTNEDGQKTTHYEGEPTSPTQNSGGGANSSAKGNMGQALISVASNVAMGYAMMQAFQGSCSGGFTCVWPFLAMGLASFAMAGDSGGKASDSYRGATAVDFCPNGSCIPGKVDYPGYDNDGGGGGIWDIDPSTTLPTGPYKNVGELQKAMAGLKGELDKTGYKLDPTGSKIITPDGKEMSLSAVSDMATNGTGLSEEEFAAVKDGLKKANEDLASQFNVAAMGFESGGGGGAGGLGKFDFKGVDNSALNDYLKRLQGGRKPASIAGMKRKVGNDNIGVAGDNIFDMIHRRYQDKRKQNILIEGGSHTPAPSTRF